MIKFDSELLVSLGKINYFSQIFNNFFISFIGVVTGIKPGHFSISLNTRFDLNGGYIGIIEWFYNLNRQQSFVTLAMRNMLSIAINYDEAVEYLSKIPLLAPCYYILAGSKPGQVTKIFPYIISTLLIDRAS